MAERSEGAGPRVGVQPIGAAHESRGGILDVRWQVINESGESIQILDTWLPHSRFFAERQTYDPAVELAPAASQTIDRAVRYSASPGEVLENIFLNLRLRFHGRQWRVLARMKAERQATGLISVAVEALTAHQIGFAEAGPGQGGQSNG